jgi:hypothetical protein
VFWCCGQPFREEKKKEMREIYDKKEKPCEIKIVSTSSLRKTIFRID